MSRKRIKTASKQATGIQRKRGHVKPVRTVGQKHENEIEISRKLGGHLTKICWTCVSYPGAPRRGVSCGAGPGPRAGSASRPGRLATAWTLPAVTKHISRQASTCGNLRIFHGVSHIGLRMTSKVCYRYLGGRLSMYCPRPGSGRNSGLISIPRTWVFGFMSAVLWRVLPRIWQKPGWIVLSRA